MNNRLQMLLLASALLVACGGAQPSVTAPAPEPAPAASRPTEGAKATPQPPSTIWITAHGGTQASPARPPNAVTTPPSPSRYRIEPAKGGGYEAIEVVGAEDGRRAPVAEAEVAKLVALATSLGPKMCPGHHSAHNDPEIHFAGATKVDALGGIALACSPGDQKCSECVESFGKLHAAVHDVVHRALP